MILYCESMTIPIRNAVRENATSSPIAMEVSMGMLLPLLLGCALGNRVKYIITFFILLSIHNENSSLLYPVRCKSELG